MVRTSNRFALVALVSAGILVGARPALAQYLPPVSNPLQNVPAPTVPNFPPPNLPNFTPPRLPNVPVPPVPPPVDLSREINKLRDEATKVTNRFDADRRNVERRLRDLDRYKGLATSMQDGQWQEAHRQLTAAGVVASNRADVQKGLRGGLTIFVPAKEFDHAEQVVFAKALGASVATANPVPALAYIEKFALESKGTLLRNLQNAPDEVRRKLVQEFDLLLVAALDRAVRTGRPLEFTLHGVDVRIGLATYNHWVDVRYDWPELVHAGRPLGVQLYRIDTHAKNARIPLPNTFQPYIQVRVRNQIR